MTLDQAKQVSDILQKINFINEIINNLQFEKTHDIQFNKGQNLRSFVVGDSEFVNIIVNNFINTLTKEIWDLNKQLENL